MIIRKELKDHIIKQISGQICLMLEISELCNDDKISCEECIGLALKAIAEK